MAGLMSKITQFARSPKGRELTAKAQQMAKDPETKRKIAELRGGKGRKRP